MSLQGQSRVQISSGSSGRDIPVSWSSMSHALSGFETDCSLRTPLLFHCPANLPLSLSIFSDNTGALQCITAISPGYDIDQTLRFWELLFKMIDKRPNSNIDIIWVPGHGIKGNKLADKLAKEGTSLPSIYPHAASADFIGSINPQQLHDEWTCWWNTDPT